MAEKTILYVEDNYHNRRIVRKILSTRGYQVVEAEDGLVGYEMICELKPPLVLLDIALPHLDGIQIVQRLKADKDTRHIPVVALTASAMRGDRERFLEAGCDDYLSKPVRAHELIEMVERYYDPTKESTAAGTASRDEEMRPVEQKFYTHADILENGDAPVAPEPEKKPPATSKKTTAKGQRAGEKKSQAVATASAVKTRPSTAEHEWKIERTVAEMLSTLVILPPSPDIPLAMPAAEPEEQQAIEKNVAMMLSGVQAEPPAPELRLLHNPVEARPAPADAVPHGEIQPETEDLAAMDQGTPQTDSTGDIWIIDTDPTDARLVSRLLAAKLKVKTTVVPIQEAGSRAHTPPALVIIGARRVDEQIDETVQAVRAMDGAASVPYVVLTKEAPNATEIAQFAPGAALVWLKEDLLDSGFMQRLGDLLNSETVPLEREMRTSVSARDSSNKGTVLVIEDISDSAALAEKILANHSYIPLLADSGEAGMNIAKEQHPDLILLDLGLPDVDGQTLIGILRADPGLKDTPIILCTAWPKDTLEKMVEAYGFDGYISKPYKVAEFLQVIEAHTA